MRAMYRNDEDVARMHIASLLERHREQADAIPEHLRHLYARRVARALAGKVALGGAVVLAGLIGSGMIAGSLWPPHHRHDGSPDLTILLFALWAAAALAYVLGRVLARVRLRDALAREMGTSGDVHEVRARLEAASPEARVRGLIEEQERRSVALPLAGFLMLAPISLHFLVYCGIYAATDERGGLLENFDKWLVLSLVLVGHVQVLVACLAFRYARKLREMATDEIVENPPAGGGTTLGYAVLASLVPGGILYLIPPMITAVTGGLVLVPAFSILRNRLVAERRLLEV